MSKGLSNNQKAEISKNEVKTRILVTITLNNEAHEVVRILENDTIGSFTHNGNVYFSAMVKRSKIESRMEGGPQKCGVTISNINRAYSQILVAEAEKGDSLTNSRCVIQEVIFYDNEDLLLLDDTSELHLENGNSIYLEAFDSVLDNAVTIFDGYINNVQLTETEFTFDVERILGGYSTQSPNTTYDVNCQWIFKDERCQYSGAEMFCDKTFSSCLARGNETRFGGYPSIPSELVIRG
jgi:phage-related protein